MQQASRPDRLWWSGEKVPESGIYAADDREVALVRGRRFPPTRGPLTPWKAVRIARRAGAGDVAQSTDEAQEGARAPGA